MRPGEKMMVLIGPDPFTVRLIDHAARVAADSGIAWAAIYLHSQRHAIMDEPARDRVEAYLRLAEHRGAQTVRLSGSRPAADILGYARQNGFSRIVVGITRRRWWQPPWRAAFAHELIAAADGLEVTVLHGGLNRGPEVPTPPARLSLFLAQPLDYGLAAVAVAICTGMGLALRDHTPATNLAMVYLTGVVMVAARLGLGPSVLASLLSVSAFNFFFTKPYYTFNMSDSYYYVTLAFMLVTSLVVGSLTARLSRHVQLVSNRERETQTLYDLTRGLSAERSVDRLCEVATDHLNGPFNVQVTLVFTEPNGGLKFWPASALKEEVKEMSAVEWVLGNGQMAGRGTATLPSAAGLYLPLLAEDEVLGVLGIMPLDGHAFTGGEIVRFGTVASLIAGGVQRARRADQAQQSKIESENEKLRNVLLSSLSHDLRTQLTVMNGSVSNLLRMRKELPRRAMDELTALWSQLSRLQKFVGNLLDMAAITSGRMRFNFQPYTIQEIIGAAISQVQGGREGRTIVTQMTGVLPMVFIDGALIEQVLVNLLENACKHTTKDGQIVIQAERDGDRVRVRVSDNGEGLKPGDESRIFEQFQIGQTVSSDRGGGTGLGLAICRGIIQAHGGLIHACNNTDGAGASFIFTVSAAASE